MGDQRDVPTCELGFWKPMHEGCPVCGPDGPCTDPEYEALIQATARRDRLHTRIKWALAIILLAVIVIGAMS